MGLVVSVALESAPQPHQSEQKLAEEITFGPLLVLGAAVQAVKQAEPMAQSRAVPMHRADLGQPAQGVALRAMVPRYLYSAEPRFVWRQ